MGDEENETKEVFQVHMAELMWDTIFTLKQIEPLLVKESSLHSVVYH